MSSAIGSLTIRINIAGGPIFPLTALIVKKNRQRTLFACLSVPRSISRGG